MVSDSKSKTELPKGWELTTLGDIAKWGSGGTPSRKNPSYYEGDIPWLKTGELGPKYVYSTGEKISKEALKNSSAKLFPKGAVCIAMYGATIGKTSILGIDCSTNQACAVAITSPEHIDNKYLYEYLSSQKREFINVGTGGAQPNISQTVIKAWPFPLPPLNEQKRIVAKIEELFSELDAGEQSLRDARQQLTLYRQSLLKQAFEGKLTETWRANNPDKLEDPETLLASIQQERESRHQQQLQDWQQAINEWEQNSKEGKKPTKPRKPQAVEEFTKAEIAKQKELPNNWSYSRLGISIASIEAGKSFSCEERPPSVDEIGVAKVSALTWGEYDEEESKTCKDPQKVVPEYFIKGDDFLLSRANTIDLVGTAVIVRKTTKNIMLSDKSLRINFAGIDRNFILQFLRSRPGRLEIMERSTGNQESMRNIGQDRIKAIMTPFCSLAEQQEIVRILDEQFTAIEQNEKEINHALTQSQALRQSILKKAFKGKLYNQNQ